MTAEDRKRFELMTEREMLMHLIERVETIANSQISTVTRVARLEDAQGLSPPETVRQ